MFNELTLGCSSLPDSMIEMAEDNAFKTCGSQKMNQHDRIAPSRNTSQICCIAL